MIYCDDFGHNKGGKTVFFDFIDPACFVDNYKRWGLFHTVHRHRIGIGHRLSLSHLMISNVLFFLWKKYDAGLIKDVLLSTQG